MHRLPSKSAIHRFRLAAALQCLKCILAPAAGGVFIYSSIRNDRDLGMMAAAMFVLTVLAMALQWAVATRTNCPLCVSPVLATSRCAKSRHAGRLFGSRRLYVAVSILFRNSFRCPYCNEPTALEVRQRRHTSPHRG